MIYQFMVRRGTVKETLFLEASSEELAFRVMEAYCKKKALKHLGMVRPWLVADEKILGEGLATPVEPQKATLTERVKQAVGI